MMPSFPTAAAGAAPAPAGAPEPRLEELAALCKACADSLRLQILRVLRNESASVQELCELFSIRQSALSHHLKVLASASLVARRREGNYIFYHRAEAPASGCLGRLRADLFRATDAMELPTVLQRGLATLHLQREANSRAFFERNAEKFREQQDLIASWEQYSGPVTAMLAEAPVSGRGVAIEVGPGDGRFLPELAARFERVIALDSSETMLESARARAAEAGLENVEFVLGDTGSERLSGVSASCVVANMVLHHTRGPDAVIRDIARRLVPGGVALITELCAHKHAWARESCGDLWLGFTPEQISAWAKTHGLHPLASSILTQRNGFQVQVRLFGTASQQH